MVAELITEELNKVYNASWLLDGFPRTIGQANMLDDKLDHAKQTLNMVVNLDVPESVILQRVMDRWIHVPSGRVYSLSYNPPLEEGKDDVTGEPLTRRPDDDPEVFRVRLHKHHELTEPLLEHYNKRGLLHTFKGDTSDLIYTQLKVAVEERFNTTS